jgi:DNA-directed RNA polymerase specialized sigma24 family protein
MSLQDLDDMALIEKARQGSAPAFETLFSRHRAAVDAYIGSRVRRREDVEDISQDTWTEVLKKLSQYDSQRANFAAFAKNHAHWKMVAYYEELGERGRVEILAQDLLRNELPFEEESGATDILRRVKDSSPSPEERSEKAELFDRFLKVAFSSSIAPHQLISFGFARLLEWRPREIVAELSEQFLRNLEARLEDDYSRILLGQKTYLRERLSPLREKMDCEVDDVIEDPNTRAVYAHLLNHLVGQTKLSDYYTIHGNPEQNIDEWCWSVKRRVLLELLKR